MKQTRFALGSLAALAFACVVLFIVFQPGRESSPPVPLQHETPATSVWPMVGAAATAAKEMPKPPASVGTNQLLEIRREDLPTAKSVMLRLPPTALELELPTNADHKAKMDFMARHGGYALGRVLVLQQLRDIVQREDAIRKKAETLWEGMAVPQLIEQMGEPHGVTTGDDPREIDPATSARARKPNPEVVPYRNGFVLAWERRSATPFSKLKLDGHFIEFLYSSHPHVTQDQPFGSPSYKVLYLSIDGRGILTKSEWVECCAGMD